MCRILVTAFMPDCLHLDGPGNIGQPGRAQAMVACEYLGQWRRQDRQHVTGAKQGPISPQRSMRSYMMCLRSEHCFG
jgi:hypothetical protein